MYGGGTVFKSIGKTWALVGDLWDVVKKRKRHTELPTSLQADLRRSACCLPGLLLFAMVLACPTQSFGMDRYSEPMIWALGRKPAYEKRW